MGFDVLIVHALDRLARDPYIRQTLEREFAAYGVKVEFVLGGYEESAEGDVRKDLDATFGKWENAKRVERSNRGKIGKAQKGRFVAGSGPYGYTLDASVPGGLVINDGEAEIVRWMFDQMVNYGQSLRGVALVLNRQGIPSPRNKEWTFVTVNVIIRNEVYAGTCYYNVRKRQRNGQIIVRDRAEWIPIKVTPIIDHKMWVAAQRQLADNARLKRRPTKRFYLLSGMIQCADCRRAYVAQADGEGYRVYYHRARDGACRNHQLSATKLEAKIWTEIVAAINNPEQTRQGYAEAQAKHDALTRRQRDHLANLQANLAKAEARKVKLDRMYSDPELEMTKQEYLKQKGEIDAERKDLETRIETAQAELAKLHAPVSLETFDTFMAEIRRILAQQVDPTPEKQRQTLQLLHVKVLMSKDAGEPEIEGWFRPGLSSNTR